MSPKKSNRRTLSCPLCGGKFPLTAEVCHSCGMNQNCVNITCPYCRYEFVVESAVWNSLASLWKRLTSSRARRGKQSNGRDRDGHGEASLDMEEVGGICEVARLQITDPGRLTQLVSYGLFPGMRVRVVKKKPSLILEMGETELALDRDLAAAIFVRELGLENLREGG